MKKLQNNFTTPEQSKRLLELGVPADSADLYCVVKNNYTALLDEYTTYSSQEQEMIKVSKTAYRKELKKGEDILPCWSVGRLIEIYLLCAELKKPQMIFIKEDVLMMDRMINELCYMAESKRLDFSKLEEE